jgi:hypothetical protein
MGQWLAEAGYLEAATSLLLRGLEQWGKTDTEEDDRAAACAESLAKVLSAKSSTMGHRQTIVPFTACVRLITTTNPRPYRIYPLPHAVKASH